MRRGFKAEAERLATQVRSAAHIGPLGKLDVERLAEHVGASVRAADELVSRSKLERLEQIQPGAFSAATFDLNGRIVIVTNPLAEEERRRSDVSHEVAHLLLNHQVKEIEQIGKMSFFTCDADEEQEATWMAGCLLLPRELLLRSLQRGMDADGIAAANTVSTQMANFRLRTTGVLVQTRRTVR
jgi:Zn-dependent peptidase ImmA (M78 family)